MVPLRSPPVGFLVGFRWKNDDGLRWFSFVKRYTFGTTATVREKKKKKHGKRYDLGRYSGRASVYFLNFFFFSLSEPDATEKARVLKCRHRYRAARKNFFLKISEKKKRKKSFSFYAPSPAAAVNRKR